MKIINQKGKLFGIINPVDLIVILAVIALVATLGVKFLRAPIEDATSQNTDMYVTLRVRGAMPNLVKACKQIEPGEELVAGNDYIAGATVESVTTEPYTYTATTDSGEAVTATDTTKETIVIVIKSTASPSDAILKIGNQEVRTGRGFVFKTNTVEVNSTIEEISFGKPGDING